MKQNFVFVFFPLSTPQIYLVTLGRGPTPRLGTTRLNYITVYKVIKTTTSISYNSKMLLTD